jgi:predicted 3-demethylubiquinone-9 3-methyltransferase (glyoxalase superfamily)
MAKNVICLWYDGTAEEAARFYAQTFPNSAVRAVHRAPGDYPDGEEGQVLTVEFTVLGVDCLGLNGGPAFKHSESFSFQTVTEDQAETDRYWNVIVGHLPRSRSVGPDHPLQNQQAVVPGCCARSWRRSDDRTTQRRTRIARFGVTDRR